MGRRRIRVADVKEILVQWDAGGNVNGIAQRLGYSRPTVRKYVRASQRVGLGSDGRRIDEVGWERAAFSAIAQVAAGPRVGDASLAIAAYHEHLAERVGSSGCSCSSGASARSYSSLLASAASQRSRGTS